MMVYASRGREEEEIERYFRGRCLGQLWFFSIMCAWGMYLVCYTWFAEKKILRADDDDGAVSLTTYFSMIYSASQFVGSPVMGGLSDTKLGRKKVLLTAVIINTVGFPLMAIFPRVRIYLLLAVVMGFLDASTAVVKATVADFGDRDIGGMAGSARDHHFARLCYFLVRGDTKKSNEATARLTTELAVLHAHSGLGMITGLVVGEILYTFAGLRLAIASAGLVLFPVLILLLLYFPEHAVPKKEENAAPLWQPALPEAGRFRFCLVVFAYVLIMFGIGGLSSIILYYVEDRAGLGSIDVALLILEAVLITPLTAFFALRFLMPFSGLTRTNAFLTSLSASGALCVGLVPRHSVALLLIFLTVFFCGYATFPLANGPLAAQIPMSSQGRFQGQIYALTVAFTLAGQELALTLYDYEPRAPFISTAIAGYAAAILFTLAGQLTVDDADLFTPEHDDESLPQDKRSLLVSSFSTSEKTFFGATAAGAFDEYGDFENNATAPPTSTYQHSRYTTASPLHSSTDVINSDDGDITAIIHT